jgi:uncharacterized membrane protein YhhN
MTVWWLLILVTILQGAGAYFTYTRQLRDGHYFIPYMLLVSVVSSLVWCMSSKMLANTNKILYYSLVWDAALFFSYYAIPLTLYKQDIPISSVIGAALVIIGLLIAKMGAS